MVKTVIEFEHVTKSYKLYKNDKQRFLAVFSKKIPYKEKKAANDISFQIKQGESVALFGKNGAGKSTVLKMITGVTYPTEGNIKVKVYRKREYLFKRTVDGIKRR